MADRIKININKFREKLFINNRLNIPEPNLDISNDEDDFMLEQMEQERIQNEKPSFDFGFESFPIQEKGDENNFQL